MSDAVSIEVNGRVFSRWSTVSVTLVIDGIARFSLTAPFEPDDSAFRNTFKPLEYAPVTIRVGGTLLFTGVMVQIRPGVSAEGGRVVTASGYATAGLLSDCQVPSESYPIEFNDQDLKQIATAVAKSFGVGVEFQADPGPKFDRVAAGVEERALAFLIGLAKTRGLIVASGPGGGLVFAKSENPPKVAKLTGKLPVTGMTVAYDPQSVYSSVTALGFAPAWAKGRSVTVPNPLVAGIERPLVFRAEATDEADVKAAAEAKIGRMYGAAVELTLQVATWRVKNGGNLWAPNTTVSVLNSGVMFYKQTDMLIKSVTFLRTESGNTASMNLVFPESYRSKVPGSFPWE